MRPGAQRPRGDVAYRPLLRASRAAPANPLTPPAPLPFPPRVQLEALKSMRAVDSIDTFLRDYNISLPQVYTRLVVDGVPATALHKSADSRLESLAVAECVSCMITSLDVLRLGQRAVGEQYRGGGVPASLRKVCRNSVDRRPICARSLTYASAAQSSSYHPPVCPRADEIMPNLTPVCESLSKAPMVKGDHPLKVKLDAWCVGGRTAGRHSGVWKGGCSGCRLVGVG